MAEVKNPQILHKVHVQQYKSNYGMVLDECRYFETLDEALAFCKEFNNRETTFPITYSEAVYKGST